MASRNNGAMAGHGSSTWSIFVGLTMVMMIVGEAAPPAAAPAPAVDCQSVVLTMSDCLTYVSGGEKTPPAACCSELKTVIDDTPQCLCLLFNTTFTAPFGVNITMAQQLPPACKLQTPSPSLCSLVGIPVSGPVAAVAPSPTGTAPATSPSIPSSAPAPKTAVPTKGPMAPASTSPSSTNNSTNSNNAPSIATSRNAAVAASLLLLGSIFLCYPPLPLFL